MSRWKEANWDKWTLGKKIRHVLAVIASLISVVIMFLVTVYVVLVIFGIAGMFEKIKEGLLRAIIDIIFK